MGMGSRTGEKGGRGEVEGKEERLGKERQKSLLRRR